MPWNWTVFDDWESLCFDRLFTSGRNLSLLSVTWYVVLLLTSGWDNCGWWARPFLSVGYAFLPYIHSRRMRHLRWGFEGLCHFCIKLGRMLDARRLDGRVYIHRIFWHWNFIPCLVSWICILHRYGLILIQAEYAWSFGSRESSFNFPFLWSLQIRVSTDVHLSAFDFVSSIVQVVRGNLWHLIGCKRKVDFQRSVWPDRRPFLCQRLVAFILILQDEFLFGHFFHVKGFEVSVCGWFQRWQLVDRLNWRLNVSKTLLILLN